MTIHDHFDGTAHCVECKGPCQLTGDERAVSAYIRFTLELMAYNGWTKVPMLLEDPIRALHLDSARLMERASGRLVAK